jgi:hypothetical protein
MAAAAAARAEERKRAFEFDTETEIRVSEAMYAWDCCCVLPENAKHLIRERAESREVTIENGALVYRVQRYRVPQCWTRDSEWGYVAKEQSLPLSSISSMKTREIDACMSDENRRMYTLCSGCGPGVCPSCLGALCVHNPLKTMYVASKNPADESLFIYGLRDPKAFVRRVGKMMREDTKDTLADGANAIAAAVTKKLKSDKKFKADIKDAVVAAVAGSRAVAAAAPFAPPAAAAGTPSAPPAAAPAHAPTNES